MTIDIIAESYRLHELAWGAGTDHEKYMQQAFSILKNAYEDGDRRHLIINNYAAVLLNLHCNHEALNLLKQYQPQCSAYCLNYAIAIAKTGYNIHEIRKWNMAASNYPDLENAIAAYIDWQGF